MSRFRLAPVISVARESGSRVEITCDKSLPLSAFGSVVTRDMPAASRTTPSYRDRRCGKSPSVPSLSVSIYVRHGPYEAQSLRYQNVDKRY